MKCLLQKSAFHSCLIILISLLILSTNAQSAQVIEASAGDSRTIPPDFLGVNSSQANPAESDELSDMFQHLNSGHFRYPGGGIANYWNWETGKLYTDLDENKLLWWMAGMMESERTFTLEDLADTYHASGTSVVFVLNMVTDTLDHQVEMLHYVESLGVPVKRIELGNELYLDVEPYSVERYPTAEDYALASNEWAARLKDEFPGVQIAVVGSGRASAPQGARMGSWNRSIFSLLSDDIDAVAEHVYIDSGVGPRISYNGTSWGTPEEQQRQWDAYQTDEGQIALLSRSTLAWTNFNRFSAVDDTREIWMTEFNLFDWNGPVRGTWGNGLVTAGFVHNFLQDENVTLATYHSLGGGPLFPAFFPREDLWADASVPHPTPTLNELTATGNVVRIFNRAMRNADTATEMLFDPLPTETVITTEFATVWGWQFSDGETTRYLITNTNPESLTIDLRAFEIESMVVEQYSANITDFIINRDSLSLVILDASDTLELAPYSLSIILEDNE